MSQSRKRSPKDKASQRTFRTLFAKHFPKVPITVSIVGDTYRIQAPEQYADAMSELLRKNIWNALPYTVAGRTPAQYDTTVTDPAPPLTAKDVKPLMFRLFGREVKKEGLKLDLEQLLKDAVFDEKTGILYVTPPEAVRVTKAQRLFYSSFLGVPLDDIRKAWRGTGEDLPARQKALGYIPESESSPTKGPLIGCFDFDKTQGKMFYHLGRLAKLLFPPTVTQTKVADGLVELSIPREHFNLFLQGTVGPFLISFTKPLDPEVPGLDGKVVVIPPSGPKREAEKRERAFEFLLDASGSMNLGTKNFAVTKRTVASAIHKFMSQGVGVNFRSFSDQGVGLLENIVAPLKQFSTASRKEEVDSHVSGVAAWGGTPLFKTITSVLKGASEEQRTGSKPMVVVVVTDGEDTSGGAEELIKVLEGFTTPPIIYSFGEGTVNHDFFSQLATQSGATFAHLSSMKELDHALSKLTEGDEIELLMADQEIKELQLEIENQRHSIRFPLYHTGRPQMPDIATPFPSGKPSVVSYDGENYIVSPDPDHIPTEDLYDHLEAMRKEALRIVLDPQLKPADSLKKMDVLKERMEKLKSSVTDPEVVRDIEAEVVEHTKLREELNRAQKNGEASLLSLRTRCQKERGIISEEVAPVEGRCPSLLDGSGIPCEVDGVTPAKHNGAPRYDTTIPDLLKWTIPKAVAYTAAAKIRAWFRGTPKVADKPNPMPQAKPKIRLATTEPAIPREETPSLFQTIKRAAPISLDKPTPRSAPEAPQARPIPNSTRFDFGKASAVPVPRPKRAFALTKAPESLSFTETLTALNAVNTLLDLRVGEKLVGTTSWMLDKILPSHHAHPLTSSQATSLMKWQAAFPQLLNQLDKNGKDEYLQMYGFEEIEPAKEELRQLIQMTLKVLAEKKISQATFDDIRKRNAHINDVIRRGNEIRQVVKEGTELAQETGLPVDFRTASNGAVDYHLLNPEKEVEKAVRDLCHEPLVGAEGVKFWRQADPSLPETKPDLALTATALRTLKA